MIQPRLIDYLNEQINAGFDIAVIKNHLLNYGYDLPTINEHLSYISSAQKEVKHVVHLSRGTMLFFTGLFLFALLSFLTYFYLSPTTTPKQLLDLKLDILTSSVNPGETLKFNIELANLGIIKRYDVFLIYQVIDTTNKVIMSKEETIAVETRASSKSEINLPETINPSSYTLKIIARYNARIATATEIFNVAPLSATCSDGIKNWNEEGIDCGGICAPCREEKKCPESCNDSNICTKDYCSINTNYGCVSEPIIPCCGDGICSAGESYPTCSNDCKEENKTAPDDIFKGLSTFEKLEKIKDISKADPESAGKYCSAITQQLYKDSCYLNLAEITGLISNCDLIEKERAKEECYSRIAVRIKDASVCRSIAAESRRDNCYMDFVISGDYTICQQIANDYLRQSCDALKVMRELNQSENG